MADDGKAVEDLDQSDLEAIKVKQQAAWATGDFAVIGSALLLASELLCEAMDVRSGWRVLDVAAGHGNSSLAAARRGCRVVSTDFVPALLERGKIRAAAEGFRIEFQEADAENLPFGDGEFDAVISTVGVMFAPNQRRAADELMRVCKVGGKIGLVNWTPESFVGRIFKTIGKYVPPAPGLQPPFVWGTEEGLAELLASAAKRVVVRREYMFRGTSTEEWLETFRRYYGPMNKTFAALDADGQARLRADLLELAGSLNRAEDGTMVVPGAYLEVVVTR